MDDRDKKQLKQSQTDVVVAKVKHMIVEGVLSPGARLPVEKDLADQLGVSRGSLREGVRALAVMGVLQVRQGSGTYVTALDSDLLLAPMEFLVELHSGQGDLDLHSVRRVLETEACALAAARITPAALDQADQVLEQVDAMLENDTFDAARGLDADIEFHAIITEHCGNPVLRALIGAMASQTLRARMWRAMVADGVSEMTHREHRAILRALRDGDVERARLRMSVHLLEVEEFLRFSGHPGPEARAVDDRAGVTPMAL